VLHLPGRDGRREKMVNKYTAIVYIRLNASMIKQKKKNLLYFSITLYYTIYFTVISNNNNLPKNPS